LESLFSSTEPCSEIDRTNEVDCAQNVVGQDAKSGFGFDLGDASSEKPPACRHAFDGSKWVFSGASPLAHEVRIGPNASVHPLERILVEMSSQQAPLGGRATRL
jgi:acetyltransferase-like isoleucine patch superfamily enzyme